MDNFAAIYKILRVLEASMDFDEFDAETISAARLEISENRRLALLRMLADNGYIEGVSMQRPRITLKGLEYLEENSLMKRAYRQGIKDIIP